jgi:hypothetical protein
MVGAVEACNTRAVEPKMMMRFQILTASSVKKTVVYDVASCSLVETDRRFGGCIIRAMSTS